jgi:hypothetical protein
MNFVTVTADLATTHVKYLEMTAQQLLTRLQQAENVHNLSPLTHRYLPISWIPPHRLLLSLHFPALLLNQTPTTCPSSTPQGQTLRYPKPKFALSL